MDAIAFCLSNQEANNIGVPHKIQGQGLKFRSITEESNVVSCTQWHITQLVKLEESTPSSWQRDLHDQRDANNFQNQNWQSSAICFLL